MYMYMCTTSIKNHIQIGKEEEKEEVEEKEEGEEKEQVEGKRKSK